MQTNKEFTDFFRYVMGNQNLIGSIHDIERDPIGFSDKVKREIEEYGYSGDTMANEIRCELVGYLLLHKEDTVGFEIGKRMFNHLKQRGNKHYGEIWCFLIGEGLQRLLDTICEKSVKVRKESIMKLIYNGMTFEGTEDEIRHIVENPPAYKVTGLQSATDANRSSKIDETAPYTVRINPLETKKTCISGRSDCNGCPHLKNGYCTGSVLCSYPPQYQACDFCNDVPKYAFCSDVDGK